jgi:hypothetical protein
MQSLNQAFIGDKRKVAISRQAALLKKVLSIQQLAYEDREHILYSIDGFIPHAKTRLAYKK